MIWHKKVKERKKMAERTCITATQTFEQPPEWAILERQLIERMNDSAEPLLEKYVREDGSILWPTSDDFQSIDGLDDAYESFHNWPLFYALGGHEKFRDISLKEYEAITLQFQRYSCGHGHPMVVKEYEEGYDWFHQGEGYLFFYMLGLADPNNPINHKRAQRYAGFYMNEDPEVPNYDAERKLVRCAYVGSMGPAHRNFVEAPWGFAEWKEYYGLPFQDVPGFTSMLALHDTDAAVNMAKMMKKRMAYGDVATNLAITGMMTHAYLYSGEAKYKEWVAEYLAAWRQRAAENGGVIPDNVGLSGKIGETMEGKWYGGYYGWTWPHGWLSLSDAVTTAVENTLLLNRDASALDLSRAQMDILISNGIEVDGTLHVPYKFGDPGNYDYKVPWDNVLTTGPGKSGLPGYKQLLWKDGWFEFQPMNPKHAVHIWYLSQDPRDLERVKRIRNGHKHDWQQIVDTQEKDQGGHEAAWASYLCGEYPSYPEDILRYNLMQVDRRLNFIREDRQDPKTYGDYYIQNRNPITAEGLTQLTLGAPLPLYNGGLLMAVLRHFDRELKRPGLPADVGALVETIRQDRVMLRLVNLSADRPRSLTLQAGAYGEHRFKDVTYSAVKDGKIQTIQIPLAQTTLDVDLPPHADMRLEFSLERFVNEPSYRLPWD
jgi:hypothetical protein